ncbi:unnamed protein product, partial [marine sediment metagenome]
QQVLQAWKLTSGSIPTANDTQDALTFLAEQTEHFQQHPVEGSKRSAEMQALSGFCHAMMCSNAFLYVD